MDNLSDAKSERILSIYSRLLSGDVINKGEESLSFGVSQRTIQRDITDIQCFLQNYNSELGDTQSIVFDRSRKGYRLEKRVRNELEPEELLAICKILLESRALVKEEMFPIIYKLLGRFEKTEQYFVKECISNEMFHYVELNHHRKLLDKIWLLEKAVKEQRYIVIKYCKLASNDHVLRKIKATGIMFAEFYFYLTGFIEEEEIERQHTEASHITPTIYRVDRIQEINLLDEHFSVPYSDRFEEGEFRKRVQFMHGGRLRRIRLRCKKMCIEAVLDRLPTAQIVGETEEEYIVRAEVFGNGIDMWVAGQGMIEYEKDEVKCI